MALNWFKPLRIKRKAAPQKKEEQEVPLKNVNKEYCKGLDQYRAVI